MTKRKESIESLKFLLVKMHAIVVVFSMLYNHSQASLI